MVYNGERQSGGNDIAGGGRYEIYLRFYDLRAVDKPKAAAYE
jgi:hypothetical protein